MIVQIVPSLFLLILFWQTRFPLCCEQQLVDYSIPFVYLTDLLLLAWQFIILVDQDKRRSFLRFLQDQERLVNIFWVLIALIIAVNIINAISLVGALYRIIKIVEIFWLCTLITWSVINGELEVARIWKLVIYGLIPLCLLALIEIGIQGSLGLQIIGEWRFTVDTPGIATFIWQGNKWLRPYATFAHPNVLGGVLTLTVVALYRFRRSFSSLLFIFIFSLMILTLISSYSRTAWITTTGLFLIIVLQRLYARDSFKRWRSLIVLGLSFGVVMLGLYLVPNPLWSRISSSWGEDAITLVRRYDLAEYSLRLVSQYPFFGIGANQFPYWIAREGLIIGPSIWKQPVHNVSLLVLVELGLVGSVLLATLLWRIVGRFLLKIVKNSWYQQHYLVVLVLGWLVTSMLDHYWWTIQAGILLTGILMGVIWSRGLLESG